MESGPETGPQDKETLWKEENAESCLGDKVENPKAESSKDELAEAGASNTSQDVDAEIPVEQTVGATGQEKSCSNDTAPEGATCEQPARTGNGTSPSGEQREPVTDKMNRGSDDDMSKRDGHGASANVNGSHVGGDVSGTKHEHNYDQRYQEFYSFFTQDRETKDDTHDLDYRSYSREAGQGDVATQLFHEQLIEHSDHLKSNRVLIVTGILESAVSDMAYALLERPSLPKSHRFMLSSEGWRDNPSGLVSVQKIADDPWPEDGDSILLVSCGPFSDLAFPMDSVAESALRDTLRNKGRWIVVVIWGQRMSSSNGAVNRCSVDTRVANSLPFLIKEICPNVELSQAIVEELRQAIEQYGRAITSEADRVDFARTILEECRNATTESFSSMLADAGAICAKIDEEAATIQPGAPLSVEDEIIHVLAFMAAMLPGLGAAEFEELAEKLITECDARYQAAANPNDQSVPTPNKGEQAPQKKSKTEEMPLALWRRRKLALIQAAGLVSVPQPQQDASYKVTFRSQESKRVWRRYFDSAIFEVSGLFREVRHHRFLLSVSDSAIPAVCELYVAMVAVDPHEFRVNCIPELAQWCCESKSRFAAARVALVAKALLAASKTAQGMIGSFFQEVLHHRKECQIAFDMLKRLSFIRGFDSLAWLKSIIVQTPQDNGIRQSAQNHLWQMLERHPDGPIPVLRTLTGWMSSEKNSTPAIAQFSTSTTREFAQQSLMYCVLGIDRPFPLLSAIGNLSVEQNLPELLSQIFRAVLEPASAEEHAVNLLKEIGFDLSLPNEQELAVIMQSWMLLLTSDAMSENPLYRAEAVEQAIVTGLARVLDRPSRLRVAKYLMEGVEFVQGLRNWLLNDWPGNDKERGAISLGILRGGKRQVTILFRNHISDVVRLRREIIRTRVSKSAH